VFTILNQTSTFEDSHQPKRLPQQSLTARHSTQFILLTIMHSVMHDTAFISFDSVSVCDRRQDEQTDRDADHR